VSVILLVSRNPSITLTLAGAGYDVVELRPQAVEPWLLREGRPEPDAVVVAQTGPEEALATLGTLREHGVAAAALLLATDGHAWAALDGAAPGGSPATRLLVLPVSGVELVAAVAEVMSLPDAYVGAHGASPGSWLPEPAVADPAAVETEPEEGDDTPTVTRPFIDLHAGAAERAALVRETVRGLLSQVEDVYGVPESAAVVVTEARARLRADAAAILVADGDRWRPTAAEGARDDERGEILGPSCWLASTMGSARRGLVIHAAEFPGERLHGVPLAGRRHLVVAPVPPARAVLVLARDEDPAFADEEVDTLVALAAEAGPVLSAAVEARALARALAPLRDVEPMPERADALGP
jgi:hypothetical protein